MRSPPPRPVARTPVAALLAAALLPAALLPACGFDRFENVVEISFPAQTVTVEEVSLNAHRDHGEPCEDVASCRARYTAMLDTQLGSLAEEGVTGASGEVRVRDGEIDLVRRYVVPFDAPLLGRPDSVLRRAEIDHGKAPRLALVLVLPAGESVRPDIRVKGPHTHVSVPVEVPAGPDGEPAKIGTTDAWTFTRGKSRVDIVLDSGEPTPPWAQEIPGFLASLAADPIRRP